MITVMIHYVICQLMCVTDPWAHKSFMHPILSLKLGVTRIKLEPSLLNSSLYVLPKNYAFIGGMRSSIMKLAELLILQLFRGQHNKIVRQFDLALLK